MTNTIATINTILENIANLEIENVGLTGIVASELSVLSRDVSKIIDQFVSLRNKVDTELRTKIAQDDVDEQFDKLITLSHENVTKLTCRSRRAMEELGFDTKKSLPSFIAAAAGYESINTFCHFICKCECALKENKLGRHDSLRLEAVLKLLLRAIRNGYLTYISWTSEDAMFETVKSLTARSNEFGMSDDDKELLEDLGSLKHLLNTNPNESYEI